MATYYFQSLFSYMDPMDDRPSDRESLLMYSMLTKVCHLFYVELLPHVFESVEFTFPFTPDPQWLKSIAFCKELNKNREALRSLARDIRTCMVGEDLDLPWSSRRSACIQIYSRALLRHVNLESPISFLQRVWI
jgi:hypothetical protein